MQAYQNGHQNPSIVQRLSLPVADGAGSVLDSSWPAYFSHRGTAGASRLDRPADSLPAAREEIRALRERSREQEQRIRELSLLSLIDEPTGLRNERRFREDLDSTRAHAVRHNLLLSIVVLEIDDFASIRGTFGDAAEDRVLKQIACILAGTVRQYDAVARLGGGRFGVLLPSTDRTEARGVVARIRRSIEGQPWEVQPTATFGVATLESTTTSGPELMDRAVEALETAKERGGKEVVS
jgi:diguanylate cyclase (GGDEF)-like protein